MRRASVRNLAAQYHPDFAHTEHVAGSRWRCGTRSGSGDPVERELLWAAAMLHDIGTAIDYDDHHKHSRYLILNAGLPGFSPRETALIGQMARYHRKGTPALGPVRSARRATATRSCWTRCSAVLRLAEQLERSRDQAVDRVDVDVDERHASSCTCRRTRTSRSRAGPRERRRDVFEKAFGRELEISVGPKARTTARP